jgi:hypothetical protein
LVELGEEGAVALVDGDEGRDDVGEASDENDIL